MKTINEQTQLVEQSGWYLDPWNMWVHRDNPDGDSFDSLDALLAQLTPPAGGE